MNLENFHFRNRHPRIFIGTASDRYGGWIGQIYTREKYGDHITLRPHTVGGKAYTDEVLPVESIREYFEHFPVLELDYTFYRPLLDADGQPTSNTHVLRNYKRYLEKKDQIFLKAPQEICARQISRTKAPQPNPYYLNPQAFIDRFYRPAEKILGTNLTGIVFEQEYQRKKDRLPPEQAAAEWEAFFREIPRDDRYHLELRTESYLTPPLFAVLEKFGIGQVLSHWTWLPPLSKQMALGGGRFHATAGRAALIRLMTPLGLRYEETFARAHPFDRLVTGMLSPGMIHETVTLMQRAVRKGIDLYLIINNRSGGNAPLVAQEIARRFQSSFGG